MTNLMSTEIDKIALALSKFQSSIQNVIKNKAGYGYKYAELPEYLNTIRGPLSENELALVQLMEANPDHPEQEFLVTLMMHSSGQWVKSTFNLKSQSSTNKEGKSSINDMQALGSGISYLRRYAIASLCGLAQEDDDGAASQYKKKEEAKKQEEVDYGKKLRDLCAHNEVDAAEFAKFFNVTRSDIASVKKAIDNFLAMKNEFLTEKENSSELHDGCSDEVKK